MKKASLFFVVALFFLVSIGTNAQSKNGADYFAGKWSVLVKGTPDGDARMIVLLEKKDTTMVGDIRDSTGKEINSISKIELTDSTVKVYFTAQGYDVYLLLNKKNEDHTIGNLLGMFDAEGDRVKKMQ